MATNKNRQASLPAVQRDAAQQAGQVTQRIENGREETLKFTDLEIERFSSRFERKGSNDCWPWQYHANHYGHGRMWAQGRHILASHIALELAGFPRPENACALHSCDNPCCVNPRHLRWGSQLENIRDRVARGRNGAAYGMKNPSSKLSDADVLEIRASEGSSKFISEKYGVSRVMICKIRRGEAWIHVAASESGKTAVSQVQPHKEEQTGQVHECNESGRHTALPLP